MLKKIKLRYVWISIAIVFLLSIGLILACTQVKGNWTNVLVVILVICFIYLTVAIQYASFKTFRYKAKPIKYPTKSFSSTILDFPSELIKAKFDKRSSTYGSSYLKIDKTTAYKVVLVNNINEYFNNSNDSPEADSKPNKALEKCTKFICFELFFDYDEETLKKLPDFSLQGQNILYTALYFSKDEKIFKCLNYIEPEEHFKDAYENLMHDLKLQAVEIIEQ